MKGVLPMDNLPLWLTELSATDISFIKQFVLASGSLREIAKIYDISYPTVRNRLNQLIAKINAVNEQDDDSYINLIRRLTIEDKIDFEAANILINHYREEKKRNV